MYAAYGSGNMDQLIATLSDEIEWVYHGPAEIEHAGRYNGKAGVLNFFDNVNEHIEYLDFQPEQFVAQGDSVVVLGKETQRIKSNGEVLKQGWVQIYTVSNELIVKMEEFSDTANAQKAHTK